MKSRYRCPAELSTFADRYRPNGATLNPQPVDGLRVLEVAPDDVLSACEREVAALVRGGIRPEQIAVLSLAGQQRTTLGRLESLGDLVTVRADATEAARHVVVDTFLRFKGLERPWVVVAELV